MANPISAVVGFFQNDIFNGNAIPAIGHAAGTAGTAVVKDIAHAALPSGTIGVRNSAVRRVAGVGLIGVSVVLMVYGLSRLSGRKAPSVLGALPGANLISARVGTASTRARVRQTRVREAGTTQRKRETERTRQEGLDRRQDMRAARKRQTETESVEPF